MTTYDYLILGHGLAGATLAYELRQRGHARAGVSTSSAPIRLPTSPRA